MNEDKVKRIIGYNYGASMLSLGGVAFSSLGNVATQYQNIGLAFGLITGISAITAGQQLIYGEKV